MTSLQSLLQAAAEGCASSPPAPPPNLAGSRGLEQLGWRQGGRDHGNITTTHPLQAEAPPSNRPPPYCACLLQQLLRIDGKATVGGVAEEPSWPPRCRHISVSPPPYSFAKCLLLCLQPAVSGSVQRKVRQTRRAQSYIRQVGHEIVRGCGRECVRRRCAPGVHAVGQALSKQSKRRGQQRRKCGGGLRATDGEEFEQPVGV